MTIQLKKAIKRIRMWVFIIFILFVGNNVFATVSSETNRWSYDLDGVEDTYDYTTKIFESSDLTVSVYDNSAESTTTLTETTDYTVTGAGDDDGGTVVLVSPESYTSDDDLIIRIVLPLTQTTDLVENNPFLAETLEEVFDRAALRDLQLQEQLNRALLRDITQTSSITFPVAEANQILGWNSGATGIENKTPSAVGVNTLQEVFDNGQTITISNGDNQTLALTNSDTTNNPSAMTIANATTNPALYITQTGASAASALRIVNASTRGGFQIEQNGVLAGAKHSLYIVSAVANVNADSALVKIEQVSASASEPCIETTNAGTAADIELGGGRVKFPATQNASSGANTLDDYEEGTYGTADANGIIYPTTSGSITCGSSYTVSYTKIGRQVTIAGQIAVTAVSSPTGYLKLILPFAVKTGAAYAATGAVEIHQMDLSGMWTVLKAEPGQSYAYFVSSLDNASVVQEDASGVAAGDNFVFGLTYFTD